MQFFSTRDQNRKVTSSQAIAQGLSDEGGLFVPESFPQVDVKALCGLDYPALAAAVVREYLTDYDPAFLTEATRSTYGARSATACILSSCGTARPAPLRITPCS